MCISRKRRKGFRRKRSFPYARNRVSELSIRGTSTRRRQFFFSHGMTPPKPALYTASAGQIDRWKAMEDPMGRAELTMVNEQMQNNRRKEKEMKARRSGTRGELAVDVISMRFGEVKISVVLPNRILSFRVVYERLFNNADPDMKVNRSRQCNWISNKKKRKIKWSISNVSLIFARYNESKIRT